MRYQLVKKLHMVNEGLKKFAHVNKKAFEQYSNFTKQRDQLLKRREDLDKSAGSIEELVEVLDQRKDEAIERTFKQVASNFEEVFGKLVPAGRGRLIIQRRIDQASAIFALTPNILNVAFFQRTRTLKKPKIPNRTRSTITLACPSKLVDSGFTIDCHSADAAIRFLLILKSMKVSEYSNCPGDRNP
jgi:hypothetical protein